MAAAPRVPVRVVRVNEFTEFVIMSRVSTAGRRSSPPPEWLQTLLDSSEERVEEIGIVFPSSTGTLRDPSNTAHDVKEVFVFAGLPDDTSHLIRKSVATEMDEAGVPVRHISDQLGHARTSMTQDNYFGRKKVTTRGAIVLEAIGF
jgi:integrase